MEDAHDRGDKYILILGDFMIDLWLLVSDTAARTSEPHGDIQPRLRLRPELPCERAGAAAIIAQTIAVFGNRAPQHICGLGIWNPADDARWKPLGVAISDTDAPGSKFRLYRLNSTDDSSLTTTVKIRVF